MTRTKRIDPFLLVLALAVAVVAWLMLNTGCRTCAPEIVYTPQPYPVPVPVTGEQLIICHAPTYEVCDQATAAERVKCVGRNHIALEVCHEQNVGEMEAHNAAVTVEDP